MRWTAGAIGVVCATGVAISHTPYPASRLDRAKIASTRVLDREGRLLDELPSEQGGYGRWVALDDIAPDLVHATLASEDAAFYEHVGIDPTSVTRAIALDIQAGRFAYGGSTITQQLAKLLDPQPRTFRGKLSEAVDALRLEATLSKDEILEHYLNRAYYGRQSYGVEAASRRFFGKPASELTLDEAALLAALPRSPSRYDPARRPTTVTIRRAHILSLMVSRGFIDEGAARRAAVAPIRLATPERGRSAPHLLDRLALANAIPPGTPTACTTIDLALQTRLEQRLRDHLVGLAPRGVSQAGIVVVDSQTGELLAMVGSRGYEDRVRSGAVNATTALRHPGSTLKPFLYALALENGAHPGSPVLDVPVQFRGYAPRSLDGRYRGVVSMRDALGSSLNVPATRLAGELGPDNLARLLHASGLDTISTRSGANGVALPLGSAPARLVDLAEAYATLARNGVHRDLTWVVPCDPAARARLLARPGDRVISEPVAYLVTRMLADPTARRREFGMETPLDLPFEVAAKTGTSQGYVDDVVVAYTREHTVAAWAGNFDGAPTHGVLAMTGAAPLLHDAMLLVHEDATPPAFARPAGVSEVSVCPLSGMLRGPFCPHARVEEVVTARAPHDACTWHDARGTSLPAELRGWQTHVDVEPAPTGGAAVQIAGPVDGARFRLDPTLPRDTQRVLLRAVVRMPGVDHVTWEVDGHVVAEPPAPFAASIPLVPGAHSVRLVARSAEREVSDRVSILVLEGAHR